MYSRKEPRLTVRCPRALRALAALLLLALVPRAGAAEEPESQKPDAQPSQAAKAEPPQEAAKEPPKGPAKEPAKPAPPAKVPADARPLESEPAFELAADGNLTVAWKTRSPTGRGWAHFGVFMPDQDLAEPRWCGGAAEKPLDGGAGTEHRATFAVTRIAELGRWFTGKPNGAGRIAVRLAIVPRDGGEVAWIDRAIGVRWSNGRYQRVPAIVEGPFICLPEPTSITIALRTDLPARASAALVGPHGDHLFFESDGESTAHEIRAKGLYSDSIYRYEVRITPADDPVLSIAHPPARLRTAPPIECKRAFAFAHLSDSRAGDGGGEWSIEGVNARSLRDLVTMAYRCGAELVLFPGDLVTGYTTSEERFRQELRSWKRTVSPAAAFIPILPAAGNHESLIEKWSDGRERDRDDIPMERVFAEEFVNFANGPQPGPGAPPYEELVYSFDYGNTHFAVVLTSYWYTNRPGETPGNREGTIDDRQLEWLDRDCAAARARGIRHILVAGHEPGFPCGGHAGDGMYWNGKIPEILAMRDRFFKIMGAHRVLAYLCGDEHNYSRLKVGADLVPGIAAPVWQIVSGGAGAPFHVKDPTLPWAGKVESFTCQRHLCLIEIDGPKATLTVMGENGGLVERAALAGE